ncbi:hypothetical protein [Deinococcus ficus]|uniref:hypothetical protein n=1 Tax=Deinococcus ficus TaxID=317577 RepID=UPI0003FAD78D|nr:hypothetical protein [Deinococcus ficus]
MTNNQRLILVTLTDAQWLALQCLNDTWELRDDSAALAAHTPARRRAHQPILRAGAWLRSGDPRAQALNGRGGTTEVMLLGHELLYWDEDGTGLHLPGVPGLIHVIVDYGHAPAAVDSIRDGSGPPYRAISGAVAIRLAPYAVSVDLDDPAQTYDVVVLEGDPDTLDGGACG